MTKKLSKKENKILVMLAFFSLSVGLWTNFKELWLQANNLDVGQISGVLSFATFLSAVIIILVATKIKLKNIVLLIKYTLIIKILVMLLLFLFNNSNLKFVIYFLIILDMMLEKIYITSIYPLIVLIKKDDDFYSKRKLTEYLFRDLGIFLGALFIGKNIFNFNVNYNVCLFVSVIIMMCSEISLSSIKIDSQNVKSKVSFKEIFDSKINNVYFMYGIFANIAMKSALGLKMLMLTNKLSFSVTNATLYVLIIGLLSDIVGIIILKKITFKNNYINIFIKFGIRNILYLTAFLCNNVNVIMIAITWSLLISTAYENITEAPYINRIKDSNQLFFNSVRYGIWIIGESIGLFFAGVMYKLGLRYIFGFSSIFILLQIICQIILINMLKKERKIKNEQWYYEYCKGS